MWSRRPRRTAAPALTSVLASVLAVACALAGAPPAPAQSLADPLAALRPVPEHERSPERYLPSPSPDPWYSSPPRVDPATPPGTILAMWSPDVSVHAGLWVRDFTMFEQASANLNAAAALLIRGGYRIGDAALANVRDILSRDVAACTAALDSMPEALQEQDPVLVNKWRELLRGLERYSVVPGSE